MSELMPYVLNSNIELSDFKVDTN